MSYLSKSLKDTDSEIFELIKSEEKRQQEQISLIPSENISPKSIREEIGSVLMNKYSEGLAEKRYYQGNEYIDKIETLAIERAKKLFKVPHANVQPYSGSPANAAVYFAILSQGDKVMGLELGSGGHLTHGHPNITFSGKYFKSVQYTVDEKSNQIDYDKLQEFAQKEKPQIIVSGTTAYPRILDFKKFGKIAQSVGAYHLADISHIAGLVAGGVHPSPVDYADVVMFTTHKSLWGPRGAVLLVTEKGLKKDPDLVNKIDKAVFPGLQGGPHNNTTAGIATALKHAQTSEFKKYAKQIVKNSETLSKELLKNSFELITGGTDNHLILIDLTNKNTDGWCAAWALEYAGIIVNRNSIPFDKRSAFYPSGIRLGTPAVTARGMKEPEMKLIAGWISDVVNEASRIEDLVADKKEFRNQAQENKVIRTVAKQVKSLCKKFPI